jgi:hypothetical protein
MSLQSESLILKVIRGGGWQFDTAFRSRQRCASSSPRFYAPHRIATLHPEHPITDPTTRRDKKVAQHG